MGADNGLSAEGDDEVRAIARRLRLAVDAAGGNKAVAERAGVPLRTLSSYLAAEADPKVTKLHRLAEACATTIDALLGSEPHSSDAENSASGAFLRSTEDMIPIPKVEVRASAGSGLIPTGTEAYHFMMLQGAWLRSLGISPGHAELMDAQGDSMRPTINDGDLMLLDRGYGQVVNGKIYVLVANGVVIVKRIHQLALGGLMLISDNKELYPPQTILGPEVNELNIVARVAWYGRAI